MRNIVHKICLRSEYKWCVTGKAGNYHFEAKRYSCVFFVWNGLPFLYIKILVSEQGNSICDKMLRYHKSKTIGNDKKSYRNSQHFAFIFGY